MRINKFWAGILLLGVGVLAALFYLGILDWQSTRTRLRLETSRLKASAQAELGTVGAGGSTAGALPRAEAASACRNNLQRIENAKRRAADRLSISVGAVPASEIARELGGQWPICPAGGAYNAGTLEITAHCSIAGNGTIEKGDDHHITSF